MKVLILKFEEIFEFIFYLLEKKLLHNFNTDGDIDFQSLYNYSKSFHTIIV